MDQKAEDFLYSLRSFGMRLGLEGMQRILRRIGNPHRHLRAVHCAGTNGKGSTLITLEHLLLASGYKVGTTISPHLVSFRERFRYNAEPISKEALDRIVAHIFEACALNTKRQEQYPTFFEIAIAIAFFWFYERQPDFCLIETGMGGRLDATNVLRPVAQVITPISYDHTRYLGSSLRQICAEKAGIIKQKVPTFCGKQHPSVYRQLARVCRHKDSILSCYGHDFMAVDGYISVREGAQDLLIDSAQLALPGQHQQHNTALALAVYCHLVPAEHRLGKEQIEAELKRVRWAGRLEYLQNTPPLLCDGAHNQSGINAACQHIQQKHTGERILVVIAMMSDKHLCFPSRDQLGVGFDLVPVLLERNRAMNTRELAAHLNNTGHHLLPELPLKDFAERCRSGEYAKDYDLICILGSLYLIGDFLQHWGTEQV